MPRRYLETKLECGHTQIWSQHEHIPELGDSVYCYACTDMRTVMSVPGAFRVKCKTCSFSCTRLTEKYAYRQIEKHLRRCPKHEIWLCDYAGKVVIVTLRQMQQNEPTLEDAPPF